MAWATVPVTAVTDYVRAVQWNEVIAAVNERAAEVGVAAHAVVAVDDYITKTTLDSIRAKVEVLIPFFRNVDDGGIGVLWTKATCLNAALGQADWTDPVITAAVTYIRDDHINELRLVLNKLRWLGIFRSGDLLHRNRIGTDSDDASWANTWTLAKVAYNAAAYANFVNQAETAAVFRTVRKVLYAGDKTIYIFNLRIRGVDFAVPNYAANLSSAKIRYAEKAAGVDGSPGTIRLFEAVDFGGATHDLACAGATYDYHLVDVATPAENATKTYSLRAEPAEPVLNDYEPLTVDVSRGFVVSLYSDEHFVLLLKLGFGYV